MSVCYAVVMKLNLDKIPNWLAAVIWLIIIAALGYLFAQAV